MKIQYQSEFLTVFESALYRTTTSLIKLHDGLLLVDPNWLPGEIAFIKNYMKDNYPNLKLHLLFTHSDYDHIIGYSAFKESISYGSLAFASLRKKDESLQSIINFYTTYYIESEYPIEYPNLNTIITQNGQVLNIGGLSVHFFLAPGHTDDGLFAIIPELGIWIAGDYLSNIEIPMVDGSFSDYMETLEKMTDIYSRFPTVNILVPGHGDTATNREEISRRIQNDTIYMSYFKTHQNLTDTRNEKYIYNLINTYSNNPQMMEIHTANVKKWLNTT